MKISYWTKCAVSDLVIWLRWLVMACLLAGAASSALAAKTYSDNGDGTVTDPTTGLIWMRCSIGQTWSGSTCTGTASSYTFDQANALTDTVAFAGQSDWRLPDIRELQTIVDRTVYNPAIDAGAFPNTPSSFFWSSTPDALYADLAWNVYFGDGYANYDGRNNGDAVRLVRPGQSLALLSTSRSDTDYADQGNGTVAHIPAKSAKVAATPQTTILQAPAFRKSFSGTAAQVLSAVTMPKGFYKISVSTTGYFQLFDISGLTVFNLFSGQANGAETIFYSSGRDVTFRTDNVRVAWTLTIENVDFSNPQPIESMNSSGTYSTSKVLGPYSVTVGSTYVLSMLTNGYFQLFSINPYESNSRSTIFNESSGNYGVETTASFPVNIILLRSDNISGLWATTVAVVAVEQAISFGIAPSLTVGGTGTVTATGGASGNAVTFTSTTPAVCTVSGTNGSTVTGVAAGICTIAANQAGNSNYLPATQVTQNITVAPPPSTGCYPLSNINESMSPAAHIGSVTVTSGGVNAKGESCLGWSAKSNDPSWITVGTTTAVSGSTTNFIVSYMVDAYSGTGLRTGTLSIGDVSNTRTYTITQYGVNGMPAPTCTLTASPATILNGSSSTLTATCTPAATFYVWTGGSCEGTTAASCTVTPAGTTAYTVAGINSIGTGSAASATVSVTTNLGVVTGTLINLSTRGQVQTGDNVMIGGFIIGGSTAKKVLIRAVGPNLANYGVSGVLADPSLQLFSGSTTIASNDDWGNAPNVAEIQASTFAPSHKLESAILTTLNPGAYTAIVSGVGGGTGVGIVEVYELDHPEVPLINISTRGKVLTGDNVMIGGFIIQGNSAQTVLIRAVGPNLANYGVTGVLANPKLQLYSGQTVVASNDDWGTSTNAADITATGLAPVNPLESAILITLQPGAYTAIVSGADGGSGVGIVEVFAQ